MVLKSQNGMKNTGVALSLSCPTPPVPLPKNKGGSRIYYGKNKKRLDCSKKISGGRKNKFFTLRQKFPETEHKPKF